MSRWARPARPVAPIAVAAAILAIWWLVAHNGGSGWVQALGDIVFGTLVIGILGPGLVLARARVKVIDAPLHGTAGESAVLHLEASTRLRVRPVIPPGEEALVGPVGGRRPPEEQVSLLPPHRGVHRDRDTRHRHRRPLRPAMVDPARRAPPALGAPCRTPAGAALVAPVTQPRRGRSTARLGPGRYR